MAEKQRPLPTIDINAAFETTIQQDQLATQKETAEVTKSSFTKLQETEKTLKAHSDILKGLGQALGRSAFQYRENMTYWFKSFAGMSNRVEIRARKAKHKEERATIERSKQGFEMQKMQVIGLNQIVKALTGNRLAEVEAKREDAAFDKKLLNAILGLQTDKEELEDTNWWELLALIGIAIAGFVMGFAEALQEQLGRLRKLLKLHKLPETLSNMWLAIKNFFGKDGKAGKLLLRIKEIIKSIDKRVTGGRLAKAFESIKTFFSKESVFGRFLTKIGNVFKSIRTVIGGTFTKVVTFVSEAFAKVQKVFGGIIKMVSGGKGGMFGRVFGFAKIFGTIAGKLFWPLTILLGAWEVIKGFIKGFKKDGIIGGIIGAIDGLWEFLIDAPLNMIKDLVSWLLKKLGFADAAKTLDSFEFDFSGMISKAFYSVVNWVRGLFGMAPLGGSDEIDVGTDSGEDEGWSLSGMLSGVWESIKNFFGEYFTWEKIKQGIKAIGSFSPAGLIMSAVEKIGTWFAELFDIDFAAVGKWFLASMGGIGKTVAGWMGLDLEGEPAGPKLTDQEKKDLKTEERLRYYADLMTEQSIAIKSLQEEVERLKNVRADRRAAGGATAINNAPTNVTQNAETIVLAGSQGHQDNTLKDATRAQSTF